MCRVLALAGPWRPLISQEVGWGSQLLEELVWRKLASLAGQPGTSFCREKISAVGEDHHPASISPTIRPTSPGAAGGWKQEATLPFLPVDKFQEGTWDWAHL